MEAFKIKGIARDGVLLIPVPKEFEQKELEVIVLSSAKEPEEVMEKEKNEKDQQKVDRLLSFIGTAQYPQFPISKYDVYDQ